MNNTLSGNCIFISKNCFIFIKKTMTKTITWLFILFIALSIPILILWWLKDYVPYMFGGMILFIFIMASIFKDRN